MARMKQFGFAVAMFILLSIYPLTAQMATSLITPKTGSPTPSSRGTTAPHARQQPCWQQAGVSQSAMQQRRQIEGSTRSQIESVCGDSSLTAQQKQEKIRQLHQQAREQMQALITAQQEQNDQFMSRKTR